MTALYGLSGVLKNTAVFKNTAVYWDFSGANATARRCKEKNKIAVYWLKWRCKETKSPGRCNSYFSGAKKYWFLSETRLFISFRDRDHRNTMDPRKYPGPNITFPGLKKYFPGLIRIDFCSAWAVSFLSLVQWWCFTLSRVQLVGPPSKQA